MKQKLSRDGIFIFNERQKELLEIEPEVRLKVIDAMFAYNLYGELPTDPILKAYFGKFKKDIDEGKAKKKDISDKRKEAIAKRWGNKPVESLEEEKGTEIPLQPLKPEIEPTREQEIEVIDEFNNDDLYYEEGMGNFIGFASSAPKEKEYEKIDDIPQPIYEAICVFFEERPWLLKQRHSFTCMVDANSQSFSRLSEDNNVGFDTIERVFNKLKEVAA